MSAVDNMFVANLGRLPRSFSFFYDDEHEVTMYRDPALRISERGTVFWSWSSQDRSVQLALGMRYRCDQKGAEVERYVGVFSVHGVPSPDLGAALSSLFMPGKATEFTLELFRPGSPPCLMITDHPSVVLYPMMADRPEPN